MATATAGPTDKRGPQTTDPRSRTASTTETGSSGNQTIATHQGSAAREESSVLSVECLGCVLMLLVLAGLGGGLLYLKSQVSKLEVRERTSGTHWTLISVALTLVVFAVTYHLANTYQQKNERDDAVHQRNMMLWNFFKVFLVVAGVAAHIVYYTKLYPKWQKQLDPYAQYKRRYFSVSWKLWSFFVLSVLAMALAKVTVKYMRHGSPIRRLRRSEASRDASRRKSLALLNPHEF